MASPQSAVASLFASTVNGARPPRLVRTVSMIASAGNCRSGDFRNEEGIAS